MRPLLYSCYYRMGSEQYPRLARVLEHTARRHCPGWDIEVVAHDMRVEKPRCGTEAFGYNTAKLDDWCARVERAELGQRVLLLDTDTVILRPLDDVWQLPFDVAYTIRPPECRLPLNGGVVFLRVSEASRGFMRRWRDENRRMLNDRAYLYRWRRAYGGLNQAALGKVLEESGPEIEVRSLPCEEWNCEDSTWAKFSEATRILHCKSNLRLSLFNLGPTDREVQHLVLLWRRIERGMLEAAG